MVNRGALRMGMTLWRWALATGLGLAGAASQAAPVVYRLLPDSSWVTFEVLHFGTSTTRGRIGPINGSVTLDRAQGRGEMGLVIDTSRVSTGLAVFDKRLAQDDLLASQQFPQAYFVASTFVLDGPRVAEVQGEFTLRDVSTGLSLKAVRFTCRPAGPDRAEGMEICGGDFEAELLRSRFGMSFGLPLVADRVRLLIQVEAVSDAAPVNAATPVKTPQP